MTKNEQPRNESNESLLKKTTRSVLANSLNLINISTFITMLGFFTIQSYLASLNHSWNIFSYNISLVNYISAGINVILGTIARFIPDAIKGTLIAIPIILIGGAILYVFIRNQKKSYTKKARINRVMNLLERIEKINLRFSIAGIVIFALMYSFIYGATYYSQSPRMFGGGMPADIILIFNEAQAVQDSTWGFGVNPQNPRQSEPIQLIMELADGIIVRHPTTNSITTIKNHVIDGIIYLDLSAPLITTP